MTDEQQTDKFSYQQLEQMLERVREERSEARADRAEAIKTGNEWRDLANERKTLVENLRGENKALIIEAAELRGYIRRVNELDPKRVRQQTQEHIFDPNGIMGRGRR